MSLVFNIKELSSDKIEAMKNYAFKLRRKFPMMKPKRLMRKVAEEFHINLIDDEPSRKPDSSSRPAGHTGAEPDNKGQAGGREPRDAALDDHLANLRRTNDRGLRSLLGPGALKL